jgi:aspartyl-tRNA(Asn)/glutamyl-tRNA(Gln) amidotransferase subunit A
MPVGFQLVGRDFSEELILQIGHAYQTQTSWHQKMPACAST